FDIDAIILMPEPVPNPANVAPRQTRTYRLRPLTEAHRRFADYLQFAFYSRYRLWIFPECIEVHVPCELLDGGNRIAYVSERQGVLTKRQGRPRAWPCRAPVPSMSWRATGPHGRQATP